MSLNDTLVEDSFEKARKAFFGTGKATSACAVELLSQQPLGPNDMLSSRSESAAQSGLKK